MLVLATLAGARTWRLLAVDGAGRPIRWRFDNLVMGINPKEFRYGLMRPKRKNVSKMAWRRHTLASSLSKGYYCSYCSGFWYTAAWVATGLAWSDSWAWQLAAGSFAASYVVGHVGLHLDAGSIGEHDDD